MFFFASMYLLLHWYWSNMSACTTREDIASEIQRLKTVMLPTRAKDLYVGRGFKLPAWVCLAHQHVELYIKLQLCVYSIERCYWHWWANVALVSFLYISDTCHVCWWFCPFLIYVMSSSNHVGHPYSILYCSLNFHVSEFQCYTWMLLPLVSSFHVSVPSVPPGTLVHSLLEQLPAKRILRSLILSESVGNASLFVICQNKVLYRLYPQERELKYATNQNH